MKPAVVVFNVLGAFALGASGLAAKINNDGGGGGGGTLLVSPRGDTYTTFVPSWEVEVRPGGETAVLNGTVQEVRAQLLELNPRWESDVGRHTLDRRIIANYPDCRKDGAFKLGDDVHCGRWKDAGIDWHDTLWHAEVHLWGWPGKPRNGPGPGNCGRVSCENNIGVWWCNDEPHPKELESFDWIADGVCIVLKHELCYQVGSAQIFNKDNWNVIISSDEGLNC
ncbi:hypothetical protein JDV02_000702 [Purpureocillium takamizusanense]|uniref:Cyanovirin-N domain-containing protein n=1 Tax=Purpureocillium takamizusanense TaxID=2060973 RepID=A0A9Q8Q5G4_9HYPO|nr:uncharacterized protein JDV02_000702 [Purpureocillium takamizusanense]UNI14018.1 hypothetical protein JDV02_000702 [Purpureocillium takamizusanense]